MPDALSSPSVTALARTVRLILLTEAASAKPTTTDASSSEWARP